MSDRFFIGGTAGFYYAGLWNEQWHEYLGEKIITTYRYYDENGTIIGQDADIDNSYFGGDYYYEPYEYSSFYGIACATARWTFGTKRPVQPTISLKGGMSISRRVGMFASASVGGRFCPKNKCALLWSVDYNIISYDVKKGTYQKTGYQKYDSQYRELRNDWYYDENYKYHEYLSEDATDDLYREGIEKVPADGYLQFVWGYLGISVGIEF